MSKHVARRSALVRVLAPALTVVVILVVVATTVLLMRPEGVTSRLTAADQADDVSAPLVADGAPTVTDRVPTEPATSGEPAGTGKKAHPTRPRASKIDRQLARLARQTEKLRILDGTLFKKLPPTTFRMASFNVLGASHTVRGGRHATYRSGVARMPGTISLITSHGVSVAGLQEFQPSQHGAFARSAPNWGVYPSVAAGREASANSIVWDQAVWELVDANTIAIPYFGGRLRPMPYILLRNLASEQLVWFANFHNPADAHGPAQRWRNAAVGREVALANALTADGTPVVFTGDMNDREAYYCPMTASTTLEAANGGSNVGGCAPPDRMDVDWIMGSAPVDFTLFESVREGLVRQTSDHPFVWAEATISPVS
jgi:hypothetical protein